MLWQLLVTISFVAGMQKSCTQTNLHPMTSMAVMLVGNFAFNFWKHVVLIWVDMSMPTFVFHLIAPCHCFCKLCKIKPTRVLFWCFGWLMSCTILLSWIVCPKRRLCAELCDWLGGPCCHLLISDKNVLCPLFYSEFIHCARTAGLWTHSCVV